MKTKTYSQCCSEVAIKHNVGKRLVTGHKVCYFEEAAEMYAEQFRERKSNLDLEALEKRFDETLAKMTPEDIEKYFPEDKRPKGWLSIEEHLPMMFAEDIEKGHSEFKVKYADGREDVAGVSDHNVWYYIAKEVGITHWWND